jgi:hypothetical protein
LEREGSVCHNQLLRIELAINIRGVIDTIDDWRKRKLGSYVGKYSWAEGGGRWKKKEEKNENIYLILVFFFSYTFILFVVSTF